jgi:hypothetical protein
VRAGTRSSDLRAWKPFPATASDKDAGRSHKPSTGHVILEVAVENSWPCMTGGPSGRDDLSKSRRDLLRGPAKHAVTCGTSGSPPRDEEIRAADQDGARDNAGLIGKAQVPHIERRGNCLAAKRKDASLHDPHRWTFQACPSATWPTEKETRSFRASHEGFSNPCLHPAACQASAASPFWAFRRPSPQSSPAARQSTPRLVARCGRPWSDR